MEGLVVLTRNGEINKEKNYKVMDLSDLVIETVTGEYIFKAVLNGITFNNLNFVVNRRYQMRLLVDYNYFANKVFAYLEQDFLIYYNSNKKKLNLWVNNVYWELPCHGMYGFRYWIGVVSIDAYMDCKELSIYTKEVPLSLDLNGKVYKGSVMDKRSVMLKLTLGE